MRGEEENHRVTEDAEKSFIGEKREILSRVLC